MKTLSLCVIVKDEELTLERLLSTATSFADEIVVVDTGSTDKSKQIAQKYANVYDFLWIDDFSAARNYAIELCTCDLVIWLDADDVVPQETVKKINELKLDFDCDMVIMPYETGNLRFYRERIFLNDGSHFFKGEVHEAIDLKGKIKRLECPVIHDKKKSGDPMRNLRILKKVYASRPLNDRELFYYASELYFTGSSDARSELWRFIKFYGSYSQKGQAAVYLSYLLKNETDVRLALGEGAAHINSADIYTLIGESYMREKQYRHAKNSYLQATVADEQIVFPVPERQNYLPYIRLCKCYWHLGNKQAAKYYNELALGIKPNDPYALSNSHLFD